MRGYGQYCPIALAAEIFAERWTPIIIRNLYLGCGRFTEILDGAPGLPRSVLAQRLRTLQRAGVLQHEETGRYALTASGLVRRYAGELRLGALDVRAPRWLVRELTAWGRLNPYLPRGTGVSLRG